MGDRHGDRHYLHGQRHAAVIRSSLGAGNDQLIWGEAANARRLELGWRSPNAAFIDTADRPLRISGLRSLRAVFATRFATQTPENRRTGPSLSETLWCRYLNLNNLIENRTTQNDTAVPLIGIELHPCLPAQRR